MVQSKITECMAQYNASSDKKVKLNTTQKKKYKCHEHDINLSTNFIMNMISTYLQISSWTRCSKTNFSLFICYRL